MSTTRRALFVGGTSSNAGKSWMVTAICASLRARGLRVAPFKAQNMSNHSFPCRGGGEIGRAQVAQAEACGIEPDVAMNPILLKPNGDGTSQVVLHGRVWKTLRPRDYYEQHDFLMAQVLEAYDRLARRVDAVIIEGAGSVSELNLRQSDLVNLGLVTRIGAPWVLVADIERGGIFASVIGTVSLLTPEERRLFRGFLVNKFRGDLSLFDRGIDLLEEKTSSPCLGLFPFADDVRIDAEDSLALDETVAADAARAAREHPAAGNALSPFSRREREKGWEGGNIELSRIAIVRLPRISNATDFRLLTGARWVTMPRDGDERFDFVILPGTKDTLGDLAWLRARGLDAWLLEQHRRGATLIGICGGYQMLGETIHDPHGVDSARAASAGGGGLRAAGLGLLPVDTVLGRDKTTIVRRGTTPGGVTFAAYEIHLGVTTSRVPLPPFARLEPHGQPGDGDGAPSNEARAGAGEGAAEDEGVRGERVFGTYLHGALEDAGVCSELFGVPIQQGASKAESYRQLAAWFDRHARHAERWLPLA